jgi:hypothetical protein
MQICDYCLDEFMEKGGYYDTDDAVAAIQSKKI